MPPFIILIIRIRETLTILGTKSQKITKMVKGKIDKVVQQVIEGLNRNITIEKVFDITLKNKQKYKQTRPYHELLVLVTDTGLLRPSTPPSSEWPGTGTMFGWDAWTLAPGYDDDTMDEWPIGGPDDDDEGAWWKSGDWPCTGCWLGGIDSWMPCRTVGGTFCGPVAC